MKFNKWVIRTVLGLLLFPAFMTKVQASHLRAGQITVERLNCTDLTFRIIITVYTNTGSPIRFGAGVDEYDDILDFGDGESMIVPETQNTLRPDLGRNIGIASYAVIHTYSGPGTYLISYREPNRNGGVLNMDDSFNTRFYIETRIQIDPAVGCNHSPTLGVAPIDQACSGVAFFHNPGAVDLNGDSLSYELVVPFSDRNLTVRRYQDPNTNTPRVFYADNYATANENGDGPPAFSIDPDGNLLWDAPGQQGEYNIAFVIREWRKINGVFKEIGFVRRDMQIWVTECDNDRPDLIVPADTCVEAGTTLRAIIEGLDPDNDHVRIEAFSEALDLPNAQSPATFIPAPGFRPLPYELYFEWNTQCLHVREQPYQVVFKITDDPPNGPRLATFRTWNIKVVGPKPRWQRAFAQGRNVMLDWEDYTCANAETMQIWRRVDSFMYDPANCETGMPGFLGYELIATVPVAGASSYLDDNNGAGLAPGATYCYRLVAVFPSPKGGESYMSEERCTEIRADAPVITHVTVDKTSQTDGEITIRWMKPFDADPVQFPEPYTYKVYRGDGFTGEPSVAVFSGQTSDLFTVDAALNTENNVYNYFVVGYDDNGNVIDTSATASSVRLEAMSQTQQIGLEWTAFVPWSNMTPLHPYHRIYRGPEGATEDMLQLIDSVNVNLGGFSYTDRALQHDQVYCYRIMARGAYGNPDIDEPLENFSQIVCARPSDSIPPCKVAQPVAVNPPDCDNYPDCHRNIFSNKISWTRPDTGDCQNDIAYYKIYVSTTKGGEFVFLDETTATTYTDADLPSYARCYKISAVDRSGNESPLSDEICIDNCPRYVLPNVFTPDDDGCNDVFSAYSDRNDGGEGGEEGGCRPPVESIAQCARFVESVKFRVYNRWGKEVYDYTSGSEHTIYIDWNGRDKDGGELSTGVYFYVAEVVFDSVDPARRRQTLKGWVHLIR